MFRVREGILTCSDACWFVSFADFHLRSVLSQDLCILYNWWMVM